MVAGFQDELDPEDLSSNLKEAPIHDIQDDLSDQSSDTEQKKVKEELIVGMYFCGI